MTPWPPPTPALWAPRARRWLRRFLTAMDRRKSLRLQARALRAADVEWRRRYEAWWEDHGWQTAAPTPEDAYAQVIAARRPR
jgi:hypothetical protein